MKVSRLLGRQRERGKRERGGEGERNTWDIKFDAVVSIHNANVRWLSNSLE